MPSHQLVALGDVCTQDRTIAKAADQRPVLGLDQIDSEDGTIHAAQGSKAAGGEGTYFVYDERHVLLSKLRPYLNKVGKPTSSGRCSTELVPLLPNTNILREYLFYLMRSPHMLEAAIASSTGARMPRANVDVMLREKIALPPLHEQQRIVDILDRAASIQRLRQAADEKLKEIIPALFIDMFGDPASNPKGWPMTTVGDLIESADYGSSSKAHDEATGLPMLRMGNVTVDGALDLKNLKYVELEPAEQAKFTLRKGDILFNRTNSKELVGKTGIWDGSCDAVFASYFIRLRTKPDVMTAEVLWAFMNSKHTKGLLFGMARGAIGQSNINSKELRAIRLFAPPIALQERFSQLYYDLKAKAEMSTAATTAAKSIAASLANDVFSAA
jgi:type I restriction enzyme S subunit